MSDKEFQQAVLSLLDGLETGLGGLETKMDAKFDVVMGTLQNMVSAQGRRFDRLEQRLDRVETRLDRIEGRLEEQSPEYA